MPRLVQGLELIFDVDVEEMGFGGGDAWTERMADSHSARRRGEITGAGGTPDDTWG